MSAMTERALQIDEAVAAGLSVSADAHSREIVEAVVMARDAREVAQVREGRRRREHAARE